MNAFGQTICLNMIVKDEASVIRRCLDSLRPIVDYWVIVDTGSTDGTQQIISEHFKDVPGELHERPWRDFAHNRSEALVLARGHADYVFVIDADEIIEITPDFQMPRLQADSYNVLIKYNGCTYLRRQLVSNALPWRYEGVLHEYITCEQAQSEQFLSGIHTIPHHDGARARDANTYRSDALVLEKALLDDPQNTRYVFYLAQSYRDAGDLELAVRHYKRRAEMGGWREEVWCSLYQIAQIEERMENDWAEVMESYLAAWQYQPDRAGPLYRIGMHYQARGEYHLAHLFFDRALKIARPEPNRLFVENMIYDYQLLLEYGVACYYVGDHASAIEANNSLLRSGLLPPHMIDQVIRNRRFSLDYLFPRVEASGETKLRVLVPLRDPGPELDDCVHSFFNQNLQSPVVFLDYGSASDQSSRIPASDSRFSFVCVNETDLLSGVAKYVRDHFSSDEVVMLLPPQQRLADADSLKQVAAMFDDPGCELAYGQFRTASGELGDAEPAPDDQPFLERAFSLSGESPLAFRARLLNPTASPMQSCDDLFRAAGFAKTRFSDAVWTIRNAFATVEPIQQTAPAVLKAKLPLISCVMVTLDRLTLAKRAIHSFATQSYPERELVIVTDGASIFRQSLERYVSALGLDQVRFVWVDEERPALGHLRNISMDAAAGEIICQWDDDDYSHPERLTIQAGHMLRQSTAACFFTDHLHFMQEHRVLCWIDWTLDGACEGAARLVPGTLMMLKDNRFRYPEEGPFARQGEDSVLLESLYHSVNVAPLSGAGHLWLYQYHGANTFSREHHYHMNSCRTSNAQLHENAEKIREAARHYPIPKPYFVVGREGPAFALN
jgi:glycosyltransferase involved in cell wall biosynthesis